MARHTLHLNRYILRSPSVLDEVEEAMSASHSPIAKIENHLYKTNTSTTISCPLSTPKQTNALIHNVQGDHSIKQKNITPKLRIPLKSTLNQPHTR